MGLGRISETDAANAGRKIRRGSVRRLDAVIKKTGGGYPEAQNGNGPLAILGGGPGGLSVAYYAAKRGIPFTVYEAGSRVGGNCVTFQHGDFLFDSGAHRFHDKDPEITGELQRLLGDALKTVDVPSKIYDNGRLVSFPLLPLDLARHLGFVAMCRAGLEVLGSRLGRRRDERTFEDLSVGRYGRTIARRFLLGYSEKLWGRPCAELSPTIAGRRLGGLNLWTFLTESLRSSASNSRHLEGRFWYPRLGIETISRRLAESFEPHRIATDSTVTGVAHDGRRVEAVEINGRMWVHAGQVVSTLPLGTLVRLMRPSPPRRILELSDVLTYRSLVLAALFVNVPSVTRAATVYFPGRDFLFTRVYEPKNRCPQMSPADRTSLVAEIPCRSGDALWSLDDDQIVGQVRSQLVDIGWIRPEQVIGSAVTRLNHAYPVLTLEAERAVPEIADYLAGFANLTLAGRNGRFVYASIHDVLRSGREIVGRLEARQGRHNPPVGEIRRDSCAG